MKKYFITGLIILLPAALTVIFVLFIFNTLTNPFLGITHKFFERYQLLHSNFLFFTPLQVQTFISKLLILISLVTFTVLLGVVARWFLIHYLIKMWEYLIHRIPLVSSIYKASQDVIRTAFSSDSSAFKQVVMIKFPNQDTQTIGLLTRDGLPNFSPALGEELVVVFVPTTPNPTSGFLTILKKSEVIPLDMPVEDAFKYVISCGVVMAPFRRSASVGDTLYKPEVVI